MEANHTPHPATRWLFRQVFVAPRALIIVLTLLVLALSPGAWAKDGGKSSDTESAVQENVDNQVLVKFKAHHLRGVRNLHGRVPSPAADQVQENLSSIGVKLQDHFNALGISVLERTDRGIPISKIIGALMRSGLVEYAEPDGKVGLEAAPNDPEYPSMWGLNNSGQLGGLPDADIDAQEAWDVETGNADNIVMVLDTGIDHTHPDLVDNIWTHPGEVPNNGLDDDGNGYVDDVHGIDTIDGLGDPDADNDPMDDHGHGTHVSGTIGARGNNGIGVVGVNHHIKLMGCKFLNFAGEGEISDAIKCLDYAQTMKVDHGFPILLTNNSWGCPGSEAGCESQLLKDAIQQAGEHNMLFIASAGNLGSNNDAAPHFPSGYDLDNIIAVAATDREDELAFFSNFGLNTVDLGAPGVEINSTLPGGLYSGPDPFWSGTSMAAPHVSGAAALIWAKEPARTYQSVKNLLMLTSDPLFALTGVTVTGGRLNINNAITCAPGSPDMRATAPREGFTSGLGQVLTISVLIHDCGAAVVGAAVIATPSTGDPQVVLLDDGIAPDRRAGDGIYTAAWLPLTPGNVTLDIAATAGTDNFNASISGVVSNSNYIFDDQVAYNWIPAEGSNGVHTAIDSTNDDIVTDVIPIGFDFQFYGVSYNEVTVSTDGNLGFGGAYIVPFNQSLPNGNSLALIAPFWDDLMGGFWGFPTDGVWYRQEGTAPNRRLIVQWNDVTQWPGLGDATFQVILYETTNEIKFQYQDVQFEPTFGSTSDNGASATVGLQNQDGTIATQYSFNAAVLNNGDAILFSQPVAGHQLKIVGGPQGTPNPVFSEQQAQLGVSAVDNEGHALSYLWTSDCAPGPNNDGTFDNAYIRNPVWTAPVHESGGQTLCTLEVTVDDGTDSDTAQFQMAVESAPLHVIDISSGPGGSPNPADPGETVDLILQASDSLGHALSFAWSASCPDLAGNGSFDDATTQNPVWTPPANGTNSPKSCTLEVTVGDGLGLSETASYGQVVNPVHALNILSGPSGSPDPVASGGQVSLAVSAEDTHAHALGYAWSACGGTFSDVNAQNPTWTAPVNEGPTPIGCLIGVTVNDGAGGLSKTGQYVQEISPAGTPGDAILSLSPETEFASMGPRGGPFTPDTMVYTVTNTGSLAMDFTVSESASWLEVSPSGGSLAPDASMPVMVSLANRATKLKDGTYTDAVVFTNTTSGTGNISIPASITVGSEPPPPPPPPPPGDVQVTPTDGLSASGKPGATITASIVYLVTNTGATAVAYEVTNSEPWVTALILEGEGTLNPGETESVTVFINGNSTGLSAGSYGDTVVFTDTGDASVIATRPVSLNLRGKSR
ncbi:MAG: S8 family serine peptidase [Nitrospinaceae bacterium]|nr:MAG: S8 family serine peptidase [Nitrospinaceae bacterium]